MTGETSQGNLGWDENLSAKTLASAAAEDKVREAERRVRIAEAEFEAAQSAQAELYHSERLAERERYDAAQTAAESISALSQNGQLKLDEFLEVAQRLAEEIGDQGFAEYDDKVLWQAFSEPPRPGDFVLSENDLQVHKVIEAHGRTMFPILRVSSYGNEEMMTSIELRVNVVGSEAETTQVAVASNLWQIGDAERMAKMLTNAAQDHHYLYPDIEKLSHCWRVIGKSQEADEEHERALLQATSIMETVSPGGNNFEDRVKAIRFLLEHVPHAVMTRYDQAALEFVTNGLSGTLDWNRGDIQFFTCFVEASLPEDASRKQLEETHAEQLFTFMKRGRELREQTPALTD